MTDAFRKAAEWFKQFQDELCSALEQLDGDGRFLEEHWERPGGGGGRTRVLQGGALFEKAGVNFSEVSGTVPSALEKQLPGSSPSFRACGVSVVIHPRSPMVPTAHMNVRRIERGDEGWYGGGADLTPYVLFEEDARSFHVAMKEACDMFDRELYARFKRECDEYFYLPHREEARGVGGLFFDHLGEQEYPVFAFVMAVAQAFKRGYLPIAERRRHEPFTERHKKFQLLRRGRYVEFNLVHDRGTIFGLKTRGRTESILMSLPPEVHWDYGVEPEPGGFEAQLLDVLRHPRDWIDGDDET